LGGELIFLKLDHGGESRNLLAKDNPIPTFEPCEDVSVMDFFGEELIKGFGFVLFGPDRVIDSLFFVE
jgi:hypothetical protein